MIDRDHDLPVARQAQALNISRSSVYSKPRPTSAEDLKIMRRLDELHLDCPFAGSRMLRDLLHREGVSIGRRHVSTLMKRMGIEAIYRRPNTSKPAPGRGQGRKERAGGGRARRLPDRDRLRPRRRRDQRQGGGEALCGEGAALVQSADRPCGGSRRRPAARGLQRHRAAARPRILAGAADARAAQGARTARSACWRRPGSTPSRCGCRAIRSPSRSSPRSASRWWRRRRTGPARSRRRRRSTCCTTSRDRIELLVNDGPAPLGIEFDHRRLPRRPALLRPGAIDRAAIEKGPRRAPRGPGAPPAHQNGHRQAGVAPRQPPAPAPLAPGMLASHYAPRTPLRHERRQGVARRGPARLRRRPRPPAPPTPRRCSTCPTRGDLVEAAANLFAHLRSLDTEAATAIAVMPIPERGHRRGDQRPAAPRRRAARDRGRGEDGLSRLPLPERGRVGEGVPDVHRASRLRPAIPSPTLPFSRGGSCTREARFHRRRKIDYVPAMNTHVRPPLPPELIARFAAIVGERHAITDPLRAGAVPRRGPRPLSRPHAAGAAAGLGRGGRGDPQARQRDRDRGRAAGRQYRPRRRPDRVRRRGRAGADPARPHPRGRCGVEHHDLRGRAWCW